jgi:two-component system, OmpR family, KDP operon response regulator KdpE
VITAPENLISLMNTETQRGVDYDRYREMSGRDLALIVDDDMDTVSLLKLTLQREGINVIGALDGNEAIEKCTESRPTVILLDLMMPVMDGWQTMKQLRTISDAPVVIISAITSDEAVVRALNEGADDYIRKPFSAKEVVARVNTALRKKPNTVDTNTIYFPEQGMIVDLENNFATIDGQIQSLSPHEFAVLACLAKDANKPVAYEKIADIIWGNYSPQIQQRLKWLVHRLRQKLEDDPGNPTLIYNYRNFGYLIKR